MATIEPIRGEWPEITVIIHSEGRLGLAHVGNFLQRLDTASRYVDRRAGIAPRVEIVDLNSGSIKLGYKVIGLAISAASLATGIAAYFKTNPAAVRAGHDIINQDNGTHITIQGGTNTIILGAEHIPEWKDVIETAAAAKLPQERSPKALPEVIPGPHEGMLKRIDGQLWVQLDEWPGLILEIRDVRPEQVLLEENRRYTFEGEAVIAAPRQPSAFVLRDAMQL